jgi:hypothetical protein
VNTNQKQRDHVADLSAIKLNFLCLFLFIANCLISKIIFWLNKEEEKLMKFKNEGCVCENEDAAII